MKTPVALTRSYRTTADVMTLNAYLYEITNIRDHLYFSVRSPKLTRQRQTTTKNQKHTIQKQTLIKSGIFIPSGVLRDAWSQCQITCDVCQKANDMNGIAEHHVALCAAFAFSAVFLP